MNTKKSRTQLMLFTLIGALSATRSFAWQGPICLSNHGTQEVVITLDNVQGKPVRDPRSVVVSYIDNDGELSFKGAKASSKVPGAFDFVFAHGQNVDGVIGVLFSIPGNTMEFYKYEFEFRDGGCSGATVSIR